MKALISIVGTTGIGKTQLAIDLAKFLETEIISCDSRQFFRGMEIGTAAPNEKELQEVPHHFIGHLQVTDEYSIGKFEMDALEKLSQLFTQQDVVVMVGGSMMYEKAVLEGLNDLPEANEENRNQLLALLENEGIGKLQDLLRDMDPDYYHKVDLENPRRLVRAIDVMWQTGKKYSELIDQPKEVRNFNVIRIGIDAPREIIYNRINHRVEKMLEKGLVDEVKRLKVYRNLVALKTVGYTELFRFFDEEWSLEFAVEEIKKNSRRFAKRQLTWYRNENNIHWVNFQNSFQESLSLLNNKQIITNQ